MRWCFVQNDENAVLFVKSANYGADFAKKEKERTKEKVRKNIKAKDKKER